MTLKQMRRDSARIKRQMDIDIDLLERWAVFENRIVIPIFIDL